MLAVVGFIATDFVRIPGDMYSFSSIPKTVDAHNKLIEDGPMVQLLMWIGLWELVVTAPAIVATMSGDRAPGGKWFDVDAAAAQIIYSLFCFADFFSFTDFLVLSICDTDFAWTVAAPKDAAKMKKKVDSELMNGRLAMMAVGKS